MEQRIAIYLRLSLEDVDLRTSISKDESNSVGNQRLLIKSFISRRSELATLPTIEFCDDGYTGTNFERPQFMNMIDLVKEGKISCVIVKDLSRFGRSYLEVGDYLEHIFPFLGVRFIAVNDNYDSNDYIGSTSGIDIAFRNLIHQKYSEDLSDKVKSAMHMKMSKGEYVNHPPFGYMKSPENKHRIVKDPETAPIVREIFDSILAGRSTSDIAVSFNTRQILTPMAYKQWKSRKEHEGRRSIWNHRTILRILRDLKYTGAMVNHKCENRHIRDKSQRRIPMEEWIITNDMHEAIVSKEEFELANAAIRQVAKCKKKPRNNLDRVFYCGHCGRKLRKSCNTNNYFACETSVYHPEIDCGDFRWREDDLENILLETYKGQLLLLESKLKKIRTSQKAAKPVDYVSEIHRLEQKLDFYKTEKLQRYEEYRSGKLTKDDFIKQKALLMEKTADVETKKAAAEQQLLQSQKELESQQNALKAMTEITDNVGISDDALREQMFEDIDRVLVFSNEDIEIHWKFDDLFTVRDESSSGERLSNVG